MNSPNPPYGISSMADSRLSATLARSQENIPGILRIQSIARSLATDGAQVRSIATLFHERTSLTVTWTSRQTDIRLRRGSLVKIRWGAATECPDGAIRIDRLVLVDRPDPATNLFATIPLSWVSDRALVARAMILWDQLPRNLALLFNALMWNGDRFHRYVYGPSSINGHHNFANGNLVHSVEVAEAAMAFGRLYPNVNLDLLGFGGLVHDAAKADEYVYDRQRRRYSMSPRGALVGHRDTLIDWLATARFVSRVAISEPSYLMLMHMLNASPGAAPWIGLRKPLTQEAELLSAADRMSANGELYARCAPPKETGGFGHFHPHLKGRPYALPIARLASFENRTATNDDRTPFSDFAEQNGLDNDSASN